MLATGEGAAPLLEDIAIAGKGRFYAGTDLEQVPQIMAEEAVIASRNFITEGEFLPEVDSDDDVVAPLTESPPLFGYVATTAKGQATHAAAHRARPRPAAGHVAGRARPGVELDERRHRLVGGVVVVGRLRRLLVPAS